MNAFEWHLPGLEKHLWNIFFIVSGGWKAATCTWNKQFPRGALKTSQNS